MGDVSDMTGNFQSCGEIESMQELEFDEQLGKLEQVEEINKNLLIQQNCA